MPPCVASTSRVRESSLLSREERVAVDKLRRSPDLFAFLSFKEAFGPAHAFPRFTASDLGAYAFVVCWLRMLEASASRRLRPRPRAHTHILHRSTRHSGHGRASKARHDCR